MKLEVLPITFAAGETKEFRMAGRYVEILDATSAIDMLFADENGGQVGDARNVVSGLFVIAGFSSFQVKSTLAQTVTLLITDGQGGSRRQPGNVRIIDSNVDKTLALKQFFGSGSTAASPGLFSTVAIAARQTGLGGAAFKRITLASNVAQTIMMLRCDNVGTAIGGINVIQNKKFPGSGGGNFAVAGAGGGYCAAATPSAAECPGYVPAGAIDVPASQPIEVPLTTPFVITGTQCFGAIGQTANARVTMVFDMEEY